MPIPDYVKCHGFPLIHVNNVKFGADLLWFIIPVYLSFFYVIGFWGLQQLIFGILMFCIGR